MKIIGKTLEGDLIISISQAEWDGLQDGIRPKNDWIAKLDEWPKTEAGRFLAITRNDRLGGLTFIKAFYRDEIDGSVQSLRDIANREIRISNLRTKTLNKLRTLLDNHTAQAEEKQ